MPLIRATPANRTPRQGRVKPTSIRGKILDLLSEEGVADAIREAPLAIADFAASIALPEGKDPAQWTKEIGATIATDLKEGKGLWHAGLRRAVDAAGNAIPGRFTLAEHMETATAWHTARQAADTAERARRRAIQEEFLRECRTPEQVQDFLEAECEGRLLAEIDRRAGA